MAIILVKFNKGEMNMNWLLGCKPHQISQLDTMAEKEISELSERLELIEKHIEKCLDHGDFELAEIIMGRRLAVQDRINKLESLKQFIGEMKK